jgi:GTPase SAR1 family protein
MVIKANHLNVDASGSIYLPYLVDWNSSTFNIIGMIEKASEAFSLDPPLFSKPADNLPEEPSSRNNSGGRGGGDAFSFAPSIVVAESPGILMTEQSSTNLSRNSSYGSHSNNNSPQPQSQSQSLTPSVVAASETRIKPSNVPHSHPHPPPPEINLLEAGTTTKWNRSKIMIVGAGRAGKTALTRSMTGETFDEHLTSTIGINAFSCDVKEMGAMMDGEQSWKKHEENPGDKTAKLLERAIVRDLKGKKSNKSNKTAAEEKEEKSKLENNNNNNKPIERQESVGLLSPIRKYFSDKLVPPSLYERIASDEDPELFERSRTKSKEYNYDYKDFERAIKPEEIDQEEIVRCLAEDTKLLHSKYTVSIYDYGGQSIFDSIHPFFLTKYGLYVIVFDLRELVSLPDKTPEVYEKEKQRCLSTILFWLNAISIHSFDEQRREMAPIFIVGSRKDYVKHPKQHEDISKLLFNVFHNHRAWPFIIPNKKGKGRRGATTLCFYPVDNRHGKDDRAVTELTSSMETEIEKSWFVNKELPLVWLKAIDRMKCLSQSSLSYSGVLTVAKHCQMSEKSVPFLLRFLHEMGIAMWHDEPSLRDVIIMDPIKYFVVPATVVICKHVHSGAGADNNNGKGDKNNTTSNNNIQNNDKDEDDATWHVLPIHEDCRKKYFDDWRVMLKAGLVSDILLNSLLAEFPQREEVIALMKKYGLLLELDLGGTKIVKKERKLFLAPSLIPLEDGSGNDMLLLQPSGEVSSSSPDGISTALEVIFAFFSSTTLFESEKLVKKEKIGCEGFLPNGLWERFLCRILPQCMKDLSLEDFSLKVRREGAILHYRGQQFRLRNDSSHNMFKVEIFEKNPIPIYLLISENIQRILDECYGSLKVLTLLPQSINPLDFITPIDSYINFTAVEKAIRENKDFQLNPLESVPLSKLKTDYNVWLYRYKQSLTLSNYDIFLSYRWNNQDSALVHSLFRCFLRHNLFKEEFSPVSVFQDQHKLQDGEDFREAFATALLESRIIVPIVTVEALKRMISHDSNQVDNLLLEWILSLCLAEKKEDQVKKKLIPIVFGSFVFDETTLEIVRMKEISAPTDILLIKNKSEEDITTTTTNNTASSNESSSIFSILDPTNLMSVFCFFNRSRPVATVEPTAATTNNTDNSSSSTAPQQQQPQSGNIVSLLSKTIIPSVTLAAAEALLNSKGLEFPESMRNVTISQIIEKLLLYKGIYYSEYDPTINLPMKIEVLANNYSERLLQSLNYLYQAHPEIKEMRMRNANDYLFYNQPLPPQFSLKRQGSTGSYSNYFNQQSSFSRSSSQQLPKMSSGLGSTRLGSSPKSGSDRSLESSPFPAPKEMEFRSPIGTNNSSAPPILSLSYFDPPKLQLQKSSSLSSTSSFAIIDYEEAWCLLQQPERSTNPEALKRLREELGLVCSKDLKYVENQDVLNLATFLKKAPRNQFLDIFNLN